MTTPTSRLGRGLGSLLGDEGMGLNRVRELTSLPVDRIFPNINQPRRFFDEEKLMELANSLKEKGMLQPILVRKLEDGTYQIIAGERRWRAAQIAGIQEIPIIEKEYDDAETLEISLLENIQREDLNPVEQARGFERLVNEYQYSHKQIGDSVGKSRMAVSNILRILKLPPAILLDLEQGRITSGHARALLSRTEDEPFLKEMVEKIVGENLSVREVERLMGQPLVVPIAPQEVPPSDSDPEPHLPHSPPVLPPLPAITEPKDSLWLASEDRLTQQFGFPVMIQRSGVKRRIIFECENDAALQQLVDLLQQNNHAG